MKFSAHRTYKRNDVGVVQPANVVPFVVIGGILAVSVLLPAIGWHTRPICLLQNILAIPCPGCGMTRAFLLLGHGQILEALRMNMLSLAAFGLLISLFFRSALGLLGWSVAIEMRRWERVTLLTTSAVATGASWAYNLWWNPALLHP
jgi:hypothetical protein